MRAREAAAQFRAVENEHGVTALERLPPDDVAALLLPASSSTMTAHLMKPTRREGALARVAKRALVKAAHR